MLSKKVLFSALLATGSLSLSAQSSTNSPYTRFGFGDLSDQIFAGNAAMGGTGYALRSNRHINPMNPASYSSVDSLSFMFDTGFSLKSSNYEEGGFKSNAKNSSFDYLAMQFRLHPKLGMAIGFTPYSTVGYNFSVSDKVNGNEDVTVANTFVGDGGTGVIFGGLGFKIIENLSIGANIGYLYGKHKYSTTATLSNGGDYTIRYNNIKFNSYKLDLGLQYTQPLNKDNSITLGLSYGLGHDLNCTEVKGIQITDGSNYSSKKEESVEDGYGIPTTYGVGLSYKYRNNLTVAFDYSLQKWSEAKYDTKLGMYNDRTRIAAGIEYIPNNLGRSYLKRIMYRAGVYYCSPYMKIPIGESLVDGAKELGVSAGLGLPLTLFQGKSVLSVTGQYVKLSAGGSNLMSEDRFVLKIGLTINETWFMKWRVN
ncbi:MAG: hypothetical protein SOX26_01860 [Phocaeicola sp.]|nr:hypothetical protein [Phocaeicola sp.]